MNRLNRLVICILCFLSTISFSASAQSSSVARRWNEALLTAIKGDFARPTVHARNLFHTSVAMYDAWAVYDDTASTFFLNHSFRHFYCPFEGIEKPANRKAAQEEAISYAMYRLLHHRFKDSPEANSSLQTFDRLMTGLGYDPSFTSTDYPTGSPAALGNYIAAQLIAFGMEDGANEARGYQNTFYAPVNSSFNPYDGNHRMENPNRWQPLRLFNFVDQSGFSSEGPPPFLSPEWGKVVPFALQKKDLTVYRKNRNNYWVYHDPGPPPMLSLEAGIEENDAYAWNFSQVARWASHLKAADSVLVDISPASIGNIKSYPASLEEYKSFYDVDEARHSGKGYALNPHTGEPYEPQLVPRGDYTRVLAEFWADGPNSETPPGHWFSILNYVNSHFLLERKFAGKGRVLDQLEWDVKSYFALGGAVHDAAIAAWGVKGYYDYVRPVSAIRYMAGLGQSSDPNLPRYHPAGIPLVEGSIELVEGGDSLASLYGANNIHKIKLYTWRGHAYKQETRSENAGVGWVLAESWWPYQLPTFVTPPFAGYVSGHSTFSRAAAEVLSHLTGNEFFPGGLSEFVIRKDHFLEFEKGPGARLVLQWAKYKDAADQCSLSRIWGGIHPPADDIPGRRMGEKIGKDAFQFAADYFAGQVRPESAPELKQDLQLYPNPLTGTSRLKVIPEPLLVDGKIRISNMLGQVVYEQAVLNNVEAIFELELPSNANGLYLLAIEREGSLLSRKFFVGNR